MRCNSKSGLARFPLAGVGLRRLAVLAACAVTMCAWPYATVALAQESENPTNRCDLDLEAMGIKRVFKLPINEVTPGFDQYYLRAWLFRVVPDASAEQVGTSASVVDTSYRDVMLLFHSPPEQLEAELGRWMIYVSGLGRVLAEIHCDYSDAKTLSLYEPFVREDERKVAFTREVMGFERDAAVRIEADDFARIALPEDPIGDIVEGSVPPQESSAKDPPTWQRNYYPWIAELDFAHVELGEAVFALDRIDCDRKGNFLLGSVGEMAVSEASGRVGVTRRQMVAANAYFGVSGDPEDEKTVASSVNETAYWCIPKKEFCHQQVKFGDFGIAAGEGETTEFEADNVVSMRHGLVKAMQRLIMDNCPQTPIEQGVR